MASSTHKKIVYAGFGCAGVFVAIGALGLWFARNSGMNVSFRPRVVSSAQATAALAALMRSDLAAPLPKPPSDSWRPDANRIRGGGRLVYTASQIAGVLIQFGDTFPEGSLRRSMWLSQAEGAKVKAVPKSAIRSIRSATTALAAGAVLLATARKLEGPANTPDALLAVESAVGLGESLQARGDLRDLVSGLRLERDAAAMLAGDSVLGGTASRRADARRWWAWADSILPGIREINQLIETAAAGPACLSPLADLVEDRRLPLATRRTIVRAIAGEWVDNPIEKTYGFADQRDSALRRLGRDTLPPELAADVSAALAAGKPGYGERIRRSAEIDRERRQFDAQ